MNIWPKIKGFFFNIEVKYSISKVYDDNIEKIFDIRYYIGFNVMVTPQMAMATDAV